MPHASAAALAGPLLNLGSVLISIGCTDVDWLVQAARMPDAQQPWVSSGSLVQATMATDHQAK